MSRFISFTIALMVISAPLVAGVAVRIHPTPKHIDVDGNTEMSVKRMPEGSLFVLTVNKGKDVSHFELQWYKNGVRLDGEIGQELRFPIATKDLEGVYTVEMSSPCKRIMSKPMQVIVEKREFFVNSEIPGENAVTGGTVQEGETSGYVLSDCQPNPVTDRATIQFTTPTASAVTLKVVDLNGQVIATLVNDVLPAGIHTVSIVPHDYDMNNALYYYVLSAPGFTDTKPLMLVK